MRYTAKDIQIFIITKNRPDMVQDTLRSVAAQIQGFECFILDNSTDEETKHIISAYPWASYVQTSPGLPMANFLKAQKLMSTQYAMILHDDDLIHPNYIELALEALNTVKDISYIGARNTIFRNDNIPQAYLKPHTLKKDYYLLESQDVFTLSFWSKPNSNWSSSIIKTELYKKIDPVSNHTSFGKMDDIAMLSQIMAKGNAVIFKDRSTFFYRVHNSSDSNNTNSSFTADQFGKCIKLFYDHSRRLKGLRRIYFLYAIDNIKNNYAKGNNAKQEKFIKQLAQEGFITKAMLAYNNRRKNIFTRLLFLPLQILYKRDFYKQFLHKLP